jgi:hypothetical protein
VLFRDHKVGSGRVTAKPSPTLFLASRVSLVLPSWGRVRIADKPGTIQKTSAGCRFGKLLPIAAELVERVERNHFNEPEFPVGLDGHPSPGEQ